MICVPGARGNPRVEGDFLPLCGKGITRVIEIIDHLLYAHGIGRDHHAIVDLPPDIRIRRGIAVERKRRGGRIFTQDKALLLHRVVTVILLVSGAVRHCGKTADIILATRRIGIVSTATEKYGD